MVIGQEYARANQVRLRRKHYCTRFVETVQYQTMGMLERMKQTPLLGKSLAGNPQFAESFYLLVGVALARAAVLSLWLSFAPSRGAIFKHGSRALGYCLSFTRDCGSLYGFDPSCSQEFFQRPRRFVSH